MLLVGSDPMERKQMRGGVRVRLLPGLLQVQDHSLRIPLPNCLTDILADVVVRHLLRQI